MMYLADDTAPADISGNPSDPSLDLVDANDRAGSAMKYKPSAASATSSSSALATQSLYASMGVSAISAIMTAFQSAASLKAQGDYEATLSRTNAAVAGLEAKESLQEGDFAASRKNLETQAVVGENRARQGASGTDVGSGSNVLQDTAVAGVGAMDELTIRNNAARKAWGFQTEAIEDTYKGQFSQLSASARSRQTLLSGGLEALEGPLAIESNYLRWSRYMGGTQSVPFNLST